MKKVASGGTAELCFRTQGFLDCPRFAAIVYRQLMNRFPCHPPLPDGPRGNSSIHNRRSTKSELRIYDDDLGGIRVRAPSDRKQTPHFIIVLIPLDAVHNQLRIGKEKLVESLCIDVLASVLHKETRTVSKEHMMNQWSLNAEFLGDLLEGFSDHR